MRSIPEKYVADTSPCDAACKNQPTDSVSLRELSSNSANSRCASAEPFCAASVNSCSARCAFHSVALLVAKSRQHAIEKAVALLGSIERSDKQRIVSVLD